MKLVFTPPELSMLVLMALESRGLDRENIIRRMELTKVGRADTEKALESLTRRRILSQEDGFWVMTPNGHLALRETYAMLEKYFDPSPSSEDMQECPTVPWLTQVRSVWVEAVSLNYAVDPELLERMLPAPLEPEIHEGSAWVQVLMSSLREMRPKGVASVLGVNFYQVSYRAAVRYRNLRGNMRRGGYFLRSETNDSLMRRIGNSLAEFKFHDFGESDMLMARDGDKLTFAAEPLPAYPGGKLLGVLDTRPLEDPPEGSVWKSLGHVHDPLVECYDAFGVAKGHVYVLTIERDAWDAEFVEPVDLYCEYMQEGVLSPGARLDSVLHVQDCNYRWRPLRREPIPGAV